MKDKDTPLPLVRKWAKMCPRVYSVLDDMHTAKGSGGLKWADYCELPIGAAFTYLVEEQKLSYSDAATIAAELTACWTWRRTKKIYMFDETLAAALAEQAYDLKDTDVLPSELLIHLPYPCIYVKAKIVENTDGFFAWIEDDVNTHQIELRIQWMSKDMQITFGQMMHILPGKTIKDCVVDTLLKTQEYTEIDLNPQEGSVEHVRIILSAVQLLLYLLSENAEIIKEPKKAQKLNAKEKTLPGNGLLRKKDDKAGNVDGYFVGIRIGAALRQSPPATEQDSDYKSSGGRGGTKRSHTRRGHWHHYWKGPKNGKRELILKWTAPTIIHPEISEDNIIVIYPVK